MTSVNNIETEYLEITRKMEWPTLFQIIRTKSSDNKYTCAEAAKPQNQEFNRYRDVNPYDHSRIVLKKGPTDYVNANLVKVERANRQYILTQGPTTKTVSHFWLMVWEQNTAAIIMLNKLIEKKQEKCSQYWPGKIGPDHILKLEDVGLQVEYVSHSDYLHYLTRTFKLTELSSTDSRTIVQYHYTTWPDFGVPGSPTVFLEFLGRVRAQGVLEETIGPAIVHCSAGIGRSGTFCLVDSVLVLIEKDGQNSVDVKEILLEMRKYRMGLIQTYEQLRFSYLAIIEGAKNLSHPDEDPPPIPYSRNLLHQLCEIEEKITFAPKQKISTKYNSKIRLSNNDDDSSLVRISRIKRTLNATKYNYNLLPVIAVSTSESTQSNNGVLSTETTENSLSMEDDEDEDEPPPLPPPRGDSLAQAQTRPVNATTVNNTKSSVGVIEEEEDEMFSCPSGPLPDAPRMNEEGSSEDELQDSSSDGDDMFEQMLIKANEAEEDVYDDLVENCLLNNDIKVDNSKDSCKDTTIGSDQNENERISNTTTSPQTAIIDANNPSSPTSPAAELRHRRRQERQQLLAAQVREMKRRQRSNERQQNNGGVWRQLKRPKTSLPD